MRSERRPRAPIALNLEEARGVRRLWLMMIKAFMIAHRYGPAVMTERARRYLARRGLRGALFGLELGDYDAFVRRTALTERERKEIERWIAEHRESLPTIGIVMPIYRPETSYLRAAVESVLSQLYPVWELVLSLDGPSDEGLAGIMNALSSDTRIKIVRGEVHQGISQASNEGARVISADWLTFLDQDDVLDERALFHMAKRILSTRPDVVYSDEDKIVGIDHRSDPFFKPDWSPHLLLSMNYIGHLLVLRRDLFGQVGGFHPMYDGSQDYDLLLRLAEYPGIHIDHVSRVLYHWRIHENSSSGGIYGVSAKPRALVAAQAALEDALHRRGYAADVDQFWPGRFHIRNHLDNPPLVSIMIPFKDRPALLEECLDSIGCSKNRTPIELILVDNGSSEPETQRVVMMAERRFETVHIVDTGDFNFSRLINLGAAHSHGSMILLLNNDTRALNATWLDEMVGFMQDKTVGVVGSKLLFPNGRIQHAGVILGLGGAAGHAFYGRSDSGGYMDLLMVSRDVAAVTGACLLTKTEVFKAVHGMDERLAVAFNDVDYCLRVRERGYTVVWTPFAQLVHEESASRGLLQPKRDINYFTERWGNLSDPFYNRNLSMDKPYYLG